MKHDPKELRNRVLAHLGGKCRNCGFDANQSALQVHHRDPAEKEGSFREMIAWEWERIESELEKCDLLCANCHMSHHAANPVRRAERTPRKSDLTKMALATQIASLKEENSRLKCDNNVLRIMLEKNGASLPKWAAKKNERIIELERENNILNTKLSEMRRRRMKK